MFYIPLVVFRTGVGCYIKGQTNHVSHGAYSLSHQCYIHMYSWRNTWYCYWINLKLCQCNSSTSAALSSGVNFSYLLSTVHQFTPSPAIIPGTAVSNANHLPISAAHRYVKYVMWVPPPSLACLLVYAYIHIRHWRNPPFKKFWLQVWFLIYYCTDFVDSSTSQNKLRSYS